MLPKIKANKTPKISIIFLLIFFLLSNGLFAQTAYEFPRGDFWSLDAGIGMSDILVEGASFQIIIDPKLWLSPLLMVGSKVGINYSAETEKSELGNILTFEGQVYLRWNFMQLRDPENPTNVFVQGGLGLLSAYRGIKNPFDEVTKTRGSLLFDFGLGITIPLTARWHVEPSLRAGYPHIFGGSVTAGYKFPLPQKTILQEGPQRTEYVAVMRNLPPNEIIKRIKISAVEYILFGPDIGRYNVGIDRDAQQLNELVLEYVSKTLKENSDFRIRIEGHANPFTINHSEVEELMLLSAMRANVVTEELKARGVNEEQIVIISFGGSRTATSEWDVRNRNRRVEMIMVQVDTN